VIQLTTEQLFLGTSGWGYDEWLGVFYPSKLRKELMLPFLSEIFPTVEVNTSFYHLPSIKSVKKWARITQDDFIFAVKIPRTITHDKKLKEDWKNDLEAYLKIIGEGFGKKLGPSLLQLPPSFTASETDRLEDFLSEWPQEYQLSVEFRHKSWLIEGERSPVFNLLDAYNVAYCIVSEPLLPPIIGPRTASFAYIRWHGFGSNIWYDYNYSKEEIREWVPRVEQILSESKQVFGFWNNHYRGNAPTNCNEILQMLGKSPKSPDQVDSGQVLKKATGKSVDRSKSLDFWLKT